MSCKLIFPAFTAQFLSSAPTAHLDEGSVDVERSLSAEGLVDVQSPLSSATIPDLVEELSDNQSFLSSAPTAHLDEGSVDVERSLPAEGLVDAQSFIRRFLGIPDAFVHPVSKTGSAQYVEAVKSLQVKKNQPVSSSDPEFPYRETLWIHEPGWHYGPWDTLDPVTLKEYKNSIETMMAASCCTPSINNNGSQNLKLEDRISGARIMAPLGETLTKSTSIHAKNGSMHALGWHTTVGEKNKDIVYYTVKSSSNRIVEKFSGLLPGLEQVQDSYSQGLSSLLPSAHHKMMNEAIRLDSPSFACLHLFYDTADPSGGICNMNFPNSLTITRSNFSNFSHRDSDATDIAYGWWWAAQLLDQNDWVLDDEVDHDLIEGGEFLIADFHTGVQFAKCKGLVEIFWRGEVDEHCTLQSSSPSHVTRFGTSIQITAKGVRAVERWKKAGGSQDRVTTAQERIDNAVLRLQKRKRAT
ncbi:hypothetical protein K435DRAFT_965135 [Dendrothele bispora CBS 962.96]|uniref:Tet-like 2OG-Fe(II) oxygenase domain-containing protein n=1 Tax=Dendrothele bispora (strain CBS 962.96) TaxID=1314807 RepID=A0A4S8M6S7_DENBC|nr:hypothetical protein K435DRAFT_965135 [Dendrothele bispora CBS 962.96]